MGLIKFANNAVSRLADNITNVATSISLTPGGGAKFPVITGSQFFMATLVKTDGTTEIVKVTARSSDTLTVVRAAEAVAGVSTSYAFSAGDRLELRLTAGSIDGRVEKPAANGTAGQALLGDGSGNVDYGNLGIAAGGTGGTSQISALQALGVIGAETVAKSGAYTVVAGDRGDVLMCSGTWTLSLTAAATLANGFAFALVNTGTGIITIDPNGSETIDGLTTKAITTGQSCIIVCDGSNFRTVGLSGGGALGGGADQIFYENGQTVTVNYSITSGKNAGSFGPIAVADGVTVTVPTGSVWSIV